MSKEAGMNIAGVFDIRCDHAVYENHVFFGRDLVG